MKPSLFLAQKPSNRVGAVCALLVEFLLICLPGISFGADDDGPITEKEKAFQFLADRGLSLFTNVYLVQNELRQRDELKIKADELMAIQKQMNVLLVQQQALNVQVDGLSQQSQTLNQNRNQLTQLRTQNFRQLAGAGQLAEVDAQIATLAQQITATDNNLGIARNQLNQVNSALLPVKFEHQRKYDELDLKTTVLRREYNELMADPNVLNALKHINADQDAWITLGPEWMYEQSSRALAEVMLKDKSFVLDIESALVKTKRSSKTQKLARVSTTFEKEFSAIMGKIVALDLRVRKDPSPASENEFKSLAKKGFELTEQVEKSYALIKEDKLLGRSAKTLEIDPEKLNPTADYIAKAKRFKDIAKVHKIEK